MDKEKINQVFQYFESMSIEIPTAVKNSIEDVFEENDNIDSVDCYHSESIEDFEKDITVKNDVVLSLGDEKTPCEHHGYITNMYTYYGDVNRVLHESIKLRDQTDELETISDYSGGDFSTLNNPADWAIIVIETVTWDGKDNSFARVPKLVIYCPISGEDEPEDTKYESIYNSIKGGEEF